MIRIWFMRAIICLLTLVCVIQKSNGQDSGFVISLWPNGAPGFEGRKDEPELAKDYWVKNVHNPSITAYLPSKEKATGAAVGALTGAAFGALTGAAVGALTGAAIGAMIGDAAGAATGKATGAEGTTVALNDKPNPPVPLLRLTRNQYVVDERARISKLEDGVLDPQAPETNPVVSQLRLLQLSPDNTSTLVVMLNRVVHELILTTWAFGPGTVKRYHKPRGANSVLHTN